MDMLDQMEPIDISDQEGLDVFFSSVGDDGVLTSPLPGITRLFTGMHRGVITFL